MADQTQSSTSYTFTDGAVRPYPEADLTVYSRFQLQFVKKDTLGRGGDGLVHLYEHTRKRSLVAVKVPRQQSAQNAEVMDKEANNFVRLGPHDHVVQLIAFSQDHVPSPAIFLEFCELGDLHFYRARWWAQEDDKDRPRRTSELSIWKLLRDMALGLHFLHDGHHTRWVHGDLKPENILVCPPDNWDMADGVPEMPIFKITDLARLTPYGTPSEGRNRRWQGTPEYAPPYEEQCRAVTPAVDMWSLGAVIQSFVFGITPVQSKQAFAAECLSRGDTSFPHLLSDEWTRPQWRRKRPTVFRPLDATREDLRVSWDLAGVSRGYEPYSTMLNEWYEDLWDKDVDTRTTSSFLVLNFVNEYTEFLKKVSGQDDPVAAPQSSSEDEVKGETIEEILAQDDEDLL
ncbi:kinase-like protein [Pyrenochaeta sp. DS3sAY3a]|nr:kinase-like protein [Pyrenochaeta sp. DS3sAY3a]